MEADDIFDILNAHFKLHNFSASHIVDRQTRPGSGHHDTFRLLSPCLFLGMENRAGVQKLQSQFQFDDINTLTESSQILQN